MAQTIHYSTASTNHTLNTTESSQQLQPTNSSKRQQISTKGSEFVAVGSNLAESFRNAQNKKPPDQVVQMDKSIDKNTDPEWISFTHDSEAEDTPESRRRFSESEHRNLLADVDEYERLSEEDDGNIGDSMSPSSHAVVDAAHSSDANGSLQPTFDITPELKNYYCKQFEKLWRMGNPPTSGTSKEPTENQALKGSDQHVQEFFRKPKLNQNQLSKIWSLADVNTDGYLNLQEFITAMHLIVRCVKGHYEIPDQLPLEFKPPVTPPRLRRTPDVDILLPSLSWSASDMRPSSRVDRHGYESAATRFGSETVNRQSVCDSYGSAPTGSLYNYGSAALSSFFGPVRQEPSLSDTASAQPPTFTAQPPRLAQQPKARRATPPELGEWSRGIEPAPVLSPQALNPPKGPPPRPPPRPPVQNEHRHARSASLDLNNSRYWQWQRSKNDEIVELLVTPTVGVKSVALDAVHRQDAHNDNEEFILSSATAGQSTVQAKDNDERLQVTSGQISRCHDQDDERRRAPATISQTTQTVDDFASTSSTLLIGGGSDDGGAPTARDRCSAMRLANERLQRQWRKLVETRAALQLQFNKYVGGDAANSTTN